MNVLYYEVINKTDLIAHYYRRIDNSDASMEYYDPRDKGWFGSIFFIKGKWLVDHNEKPRHAIKPISQEELFLRLL